MRISLLAMLPVLAATVLWGCCRQKSPANNPAEPVLVWPDTAAIQTPSFDYGLDPGRQLKALRAADPTNDATVAFAKRDYRFIKDKFAMGRVLGAPDDTIVRAAVHRYGYKVIAASAELGTNGNFTQLRNTYQDHFNAAMYSLLRGAK
jgi:hypothetical protein